MKENREKHDFFYIIWYRRLYYFNELHIKLKIHISGEF